MASIVSSASPILALLLATWFPSVCASSSFASRLQARSLLGSNFGVPGVNATYDYVVVGGGNAGLTIAGRLAEDLTASVAVIEAGSFYEITNGNLSQIPADDIYFTGKSPRDVNPLIDWGFVTTPQPGANGASYHYARGKTLGGCSARNYLAYHRGTRQSYQMWADQVEGAFSLAFSPNTCRLTSILFRPVVQLRSALTVL